MQDRLLMAATVLSLLANVYLATQLLRANEYTREQRTGLPSDVQPAATPFPVNDSEETSAIISSEPAPAFHWGQVESEDIAAYARNLSRAGFPQEAIRDALVPLMNQAYAAVLAEHARYAFPPRWAEAPNDIAERSGKAIDQAQQHRRSTLKNVFGLEFYQAEGYKPWNFNVYQRSLPQLERSERERLQAMKKERTAYRESLKARGLHGTELETAMRPLVTRQEAELSYFLPPDTIRELRVVQ